MNIDLHFSAEIWKYEGRATWHFVTLPSEIAEEVKYVRSNLQGFRTVKISAQINLTQWNTSLFPDKETGSFLLPLKADVRKKEGLVAGQVIDISIFIDV